MDFMKWLREFAEKNGLDLSEALIVVSENPPEGVEHVIDRQQEVIQWESFGQMYPTFPTGRKCENPLCPCDGTGNVVLSSAVN